MLRSFSCLRGGVAAAVVLFSLVMADSPALASCNTRGTVDIARCDVDGVDIRVEGAAGSVNLDNFTIDPVSRYGYARIYALDSAGEPTHITVDLTGATTINSYNYDGLDVRTSFGNIDVTVGTNAVINAQQAGIYVLANDVDHQGDYVGGNVTVNNYGTVIAGTYDVPMGADGISALANAGAATLNNYGSVTSTLGRGLIADGGYQAPGVVPIKIYNSGTVNAWLDGARINSYAGPALMVNDVGGLLTSHSRRGASVWSDVDNAELDNYGTITALASTGAMVWAGADASVINGGTISGAIDPMQSDVDFLFNGVHIWSETAGSASLKNLAGGNITADDGWGVWMQSTDGDVSIDNAGRISGKSTAIYVGADQLYELTTVEVPDYAGAVGGDLTVGNSGLVTAVGTAGGDSMGLITLDGVDLGALHLTNSASGVIGAGLDLTSGFDFAGWRDGSAGDLAQLAPAASNLAVAVAAQADSITIDNAGTLLGRIDVSTPDEVYDAGPDSTGDVAVNNSGLWVTSGVSSLTKAATNAGFSNSGTIWALGGTTLDGNLGNTGTLLVSDLDATKGRLTVGGDYAAGGSALLSFDAATLSDQPGDAVLTVQGDVSGTTTVRMADPTSLATLAWNQLPRGTVVKVEGDVSGGADAFTMHQTYGLVTLGLDYATATQTWSLGYSTAPTGLALASLPNIGHLLLGEHFDLTADRLEQWRDGQGSPDDAAPLGYADTHADPVSAALAQGIAEQPRYGTWLRSEGEAAAGDGRHRASGVMVGGIDGAFALGGGTRLFAGVTGSYGLGRLDFGDIGSTASVSGYGLGAYAGLALPQGGFVDLDLAWQSLGVDLTLGGLPASTSGQAWGGRIVTGQRLAAYGVNITPSLAVSASRTDLSSFGLQGLDVDFPGTTDLSAELGLEIARPVLLGIGTVKPFGKLALGGRSVYGEGVVISEGGGYAAPEDGLFGAATLGVSLSDPGAKRSAQLTGTLRRDAGETSGDLRLGVDFAF